MDKQEEKVLNEYVDAVVEDEINRNHVVEYLPTELLQHLGEAHQDTPELDVFTHVRFNRLTPRKNRLIKSAVSKLYYKDIQDDSILSNSQLVEINKKRGEWDQEREDQIEQLQTETGVLMRVLYSEGIQESQEWGEELENLYKKVEEAIKKSEKHPDELEHYKKILNRWLNYTDDEQDAYTRMYAKAQETESYNLDKDMVYLTTHAVDDESSEAIVLLDEIAYKIRQSLVLLHKQEALRNLLESRYKIFNDSVETRRDINESMARVYYGAEACDEDGENRRPLTLTLDGLFDVPESVIQWLLNESYMFNEAIPKETRELLSAWGFITKEEKDTGSLPPSEELQDPPQDNEDTQQPEADVSTLALVPQQT